MPLGQRIAHMRPEGRRRIRDLDGELLADPGDALAKMKVGKIRAPASPSRFHTVTTRTWARCLGPGYAF